MEDDIAVVEDEIKDVKDNILQKLETSITSVNGSENAEIFT